MAVETERAPRVAVLIDADNASARIADGLFQEVAKLGEASVRRIYGDFSSPQSTEWAKVMARHAIIPQQNFALTKGKNAADIALVIDAMDLLATGRFDAFCLVSSDSDFTRLASRIREQGVDVYGFGETKTPECFRMACKRFILTENLAAAKAPTPQDQAKAAEDRLAQDALPLLRKALATMDDADGWYHLGTLGSRLQSIAPDFDPRSYGCARLKALAEKTGAFDIRQNKLVAFVRFKP